MTTCMCAVSFCDYGILLYASNSHRSQPTSAVMQDIRKEAPSQKVLDTAKAQTLNSFVFNFASTNTQLQRILIYSLLGLPQDYLFQYKTGIEHVTSEDVRNAAQRHLHPEQQIVVVAADKDTFETPLTKHFGTIELLSVDLKN